MEANYKNIVKKYSLAAERGRSMLSHESYLRKKKSSREK